MIAALSLCTNSAHQQLQMCALQVPSKCPWAGLSIETVPSLRFTSLTSTSGKTIIIGGCACAGITALSLLVTPFLLQASQRILADGDPGPLLVGLP